MAKIYRLLSILIASSMLITSCATSTRELLYGEWEMELSPSLQDAGIDSMFITFDKDGTMAVSLGNTSAECDYTFLDDNTIHMTCEDEIPGLAQDMDFAINGDAMTLTIGETIMSFHRPGN